ncbi:MAG TPA: FtsX-like permease family protein [Candidatus Angelobacter sp.]|jgi:putative ABC transport system permease protein
MTRTQLLLRLLFKAAWVRKDRAFTALVSVAVVATIATAALTIYSDLEGKLSREFRGFGANVIVTSATALDSANLATMRAAVGGQNQIVPVAYVVASGYNKKPVVVGGTDIKAFREMNSSWSMRTGGYEGTTEVLLGSRAAEVFSPNAGAFWVSYAGRTYGIEPGFVFNSGSDDDSRIYLPLQDFEQWTGVQPTSVLVRVEGRPVEIQAAIARLSAALPNTEVKPVRQITQAQTAVVGKTRSVVLASSAVVVILIMLCMVATFTGSVLERRKDFAVMKALGASNRTVNFLFASEAALLALTGSTAGYILGCGIAFWIGKANFDAAILPQPMLLFPVLLGSIALALIASTAPLRLLQQIQPAGILRGE